MTIESIAFVNRGFNFAKSLLLLVGVLNIAVAQGDESLRDTVDMHLDENGAALLTEFRSLLSIPNISTNLEDMERNATWIQAYIAKRGFKSRSVSAGRAPYILAERRVEGADQTVLIYAHFDGQPVQPENWATPPFEPTLKSGSDILDWNAALDGKIDTDWRVYARAAGDDKGPVIALMHAIDLMDANNIPLSVNVKLILDGEEEFGSPTLEGILQQHADDLDADLMLFCDGPMHQTGLRQLVFGVRGNKGVHLTMYGPARPLHSGHYGNWAPHPTDALMRLLATLKDIDGKILVPGYLDEVAPISEAEKAAIAAMPRVDDQLQQELALGRIEGNGERLEYLIMQPAINIVGFQAGGTGSKARNIIVPMAQASLDLRLVKGQTQAHIKKALESHFEQQGFYVTHEEPDEETRRAHPGVIKMDWDDGYPAYRSDLDGPEAQRMADILEAYEGYPPLMTPTMGGSLPIYLFDRYTDMPIVLLPIANYDNNQHGRDENMRIQNLFSAVGVYAALLSEYGRDSE